MWIQGITDGTVVEKVMAIFKNVEGATIPADAVVALEDAATTDGIRVVQPNSGGLGLVVGLADKSIADAVVGYVQIYGYRGSSKVWKTGVAVVIGDVLKAVAAQDYLTRDDTASGINGLFYALASLASTSASATASLKVFIRCM